MRLAYKNWMKMTCPERALTRYAYRRENQWWRRKREKGKESAKNGLRH